ncbi:endonuclease III [Halothermothrix orenii]|uniref:Endonuclease III n=1 Tax=Halothermothrix orenii (strain H 168 / OCM 544 / DSM 9562) TaxID=373903 RepID=B8CX14_HALOH|nr:endonuclease III [Halothermothrix orenii]ACL69833.1 endonuclease III [Halothermothrix orenii H 168]
MASYPYLQELIKYFEDRYPAPDTELNFSTPFELLIATILSAQSTDRQVNKVTKKLFKKYKNPGDFASLDRKTLEREINSIGLYRNKSKYIIEVSNILIKEYGGKVPGTRKELLKLPGVGRKTANVVLACAFNKKTFPVDTHVFRISNRLGLVSAKRTNEAEKQLMEVIPEEKWVDMHHWLIFHGREVCKARNPACHFCELKPFCNYYKKEND